MKKREAQEKMVWANLKEKLALVPTEPGTSSMASVAWDLDLLLPLLLLLLLGLPSS